MKFTDPKYYFPEVFVPEEGYAIQEMVRDFVDKEIMPVRHLLDDADPDHELAIKIRQGLVDLGIQRMHMPEEYGGSGIKSAVINAIVGEELSRGDGGITMSMSCTNWALAPAIKANNRAVMDKFIPDFCGDKLRLACYSMTEPGGAHGGGGCDIENPGLEGRKIRTIAKLEGDEWVINGAKLWASNSGNASLYCVLCTVDPNLGNDGILLVYIPYPWEGFTLGPNEKKCGYTTDDNCPQYFDNVRVPKEWGIGPGGIAAQIFYDSVISSKAGAYNCGLMRGALEVILDYTEQRIVRDKPIQQHSIAAQVIANLAMALETSRIWYLTTCYMADHPEVYGPVNQGFYPARTKIGQVFTARLATQAIGDALNLMGSYGYVRENHIEKYWRDAKLLELTMGGMAFNSLKVCNGYYDYKY